MAQVKRIEVSGFRGILSRLEIPFQSGKSTKSMILYGRNGTGKSSLTDAWEWLTSGKVVHLAREGAEESAYSHMNAQPGTTYVEVEFVNPELGTVRLTFDEKRVRSPKVTGNLKELRNRVSHPCHIRHGNLTRFVLLRKSERYDALATLMGFVPQMEYQKMLRRVETALVADIENQRQLFLDVQRRHKDHFRNMVGESLSPLELLSRRCAENGFDCDDTPEKIKEAAAQLKQAVINDANAKKLSAIRGIKTAATNINPPVGISAKIRILREAVGNLRAAHAAEKEKLLLIPLLQAAQKLVSKIAVSGICPLCNRAFEGDLKKHVTDELATLQRIETLLAQVRAAKEALRIGLVDPCSYAPISIPETFKPDLRLTQAIAQFQATAEAAKKAVEEARDLLSFDTSELTDDLISSFRAVECTSDQASRGFQAGKKVVIDLAEELVKALENDPKRKKLVEDNEFLNTGMALIEELEASKQKGLQIKSVLDRFSPMVQRFVDLALKDVNDRFDQISDKVTTFFEVLERGTPGLGAPKLKLDASQDRSVALEVTFNGAAISPAYRYLSESQLNSFGLAVSLASATHFNKDFPFLILDDVVNSCDAYKRPQLIELLQTHLSHVQVLLMTHDRFWRDLLHKRLPSWARFDFQRYQLGVGPICKPGANFYQRIQDELDKDEAESAAGALARYLEDTAQQICESFEVELKFNRRSEYTLDPLLNGIRTRLEGKLGATHPVVQEMVRVTQDNAYRNWGIHCKNPESPIQSSEIARLVANWKALEAQFHCSSCAEMLAYDGKRFLCGCGATVLQRMTS